MVIESANWVAGWVGMVGGMVSGAVIGLFFHREAWLGGYQSFRRRLVRLGHISFFGLAFINLLYALGVSATVTPMGQVASTALIIGAVTMPICCFLAAWRKPLRHLFPIPVISLITGASITLMQGVV